MPVFVLSYIRINVQCSTYKRQRNRRHERYTVSLFFACAALHVVGLHAQPIVFNEAGGASASCNICTHSAERGCLREGTEPLPQPFMPCPLAEAEMCRFPPCPFPVRLLSRTQECASLSQGPSCLSTWGAVTNIVQSSREQSSRRQPLRTAQPTVGD